MALAYRRALLKLSGEALAGERGVGLDYSVIDRLAAEIRAVHARGVQLGLVVGGGNIVRGTTASAEGLDRVSADFMGMLATVINALALSSAIEQQGVATRVLTAIQMHQVAEPFIRRRAIRHLEKGRLVVFAGGTGNPFFTTDSAAALRANEIQAEVLIKATRVDGVFTADPLKDSGAVLMPRVSYREFLTRELKLMDAAAISLCQQTSTPIQILNIRTRGLLRRAVAGDEVGSLIGPGEAQ